MIDADLRRFSLFAGLEDPELQLVAYLLESRELAADECVWEEGQAADGLWLLDQGTLRFEMGGEGPLGRCAAPAWFGGASLLAEAPREASAHAAGPARALVLSRTAFAQLLEAAPRTAARILATLAGELASVLRDGIAFTSPRR